MKRLIPHIHIFLFLVCFKGMAKNGIPQATSPVSANKVLQIIENKGQFIDQFGKQSNDIDLKIEGVGVTMFAGKGMVHYQWSRSAVTETNGGKENQKEIPTSDVEIYRLDITLINANKDAKVIFEEPTGYYENYYQPQCPDGLTAKGFGKVIYKNVYPNIDWVVYAHADNKNPDSGIKYDFIVRRGGNPADIRLRYDGVTELKLANGALIAKTPFGSIIEETPYSYQSENKKEIISKYILDGNVLSFDVEQYEGVLVIDPVLEWSKTYASGSNSMIKSIVTDSNEHVYICGNTRSTANLVTTGAHQSVAGGNVDAFIARTGPDGSLIWATYYGGTGAENCTGITLDKNQCVYVCGGTKSSGNIATNGAHQAVFAGYEDGFLVKFDSAGVRKWGTYYGGDMNDVANAVVVDMNNDVIIAGEARSLTNIARSGGYITIYGGGTTDAFIAKFDSTGTRKWATYYGGKGEDAIHSIEIDASGNIFGGGSTYSSNGIAVFGHQNTLGGLYDGFLVKFSTTGSLIWGTYYGGDQIDHIATIDLDTAGNIYVSGETSSSSGIATTGAHLSLPPGNQEAYLAKFNTNGTRIWGTYVGGNDFEYISKIAVSNDKIFVTGTTLSTNGIATTNAHQSTISDSYDAFLAAFNSQGKLEWGTYYALQANRHDYGRAIAVDVLGNLYMGGESALTTAPSDDFLLKFCRAKDFVSGEPADLIVTVGSNAQFSITANNNNLSYQWQADNGAGYVDLTKGGQYSGVNSSVLTITSVNLSNNNQRFRCITVLGSCSAISGEAKLSVWPVSIGIPYGDNAVMYPNPVSDLLYIEGLNSETAIELYDVVGRKVNSTIARGRSCSIDTGNLPNGNYILRLSDVNGSVSYKVVK